MFCILEDMYNKLHAIIVGKGLNRLDDFSIVYENFVINVFVDVIKKDTASEKTQYPIVEGNNNRFKLIKRTLYGRANFRQSF